MVKQGRGKKGAAAAAVAAWKEAGKFAAQSGKMKLQQTFGLRSTRWRRRAESVGKGERARERTAQLETMKQAKG